VEPRVTAHAGRSGIVTLRDGRDAFAARALLADAAERTLDIRYYIWRNDMSGTPLMDAVHRAARRGVRVRLLLDDNNTQGLDSFLAALVAHPNVEMRLFNPFVYRRLRLLNYLTDFRRLNRRMHNKSLTADGQVTIIGGRNVGDEYFDADQRLAFIDLSRRAHPATHRCRLDPRRGREGCKGHGRAGGARLRRGARRRAPDVAPGVAEFSCRRARASVPSPGSLPRASRSVPSRIPSRRPMSPSCMPATPSGAGNCSGSACGCTS